MNQFHPYNEIFNDLGPIREYDERIEEQEQSVYSQINEYDRQSWQQNITDQTYDKDFLEDIKTHIDLELQEIITQTYINYKDLIQISQELTNLFGLQEIFTRKTTQLTKLCLIGNLQLEQIMDKVQKNYKHLLGQFCLYSKEINLNNVRNILQLLNSNLFKQIKKTCEEFFQKKNFKKPQVILIELHYELSKLFCIVSTFPHACAQKDIIIDQNIIEQHVVQRILGSKSEIEKDYQKVLEGVQSAQAMMQIKSETSTKLFRGIIHNLGPLYYMIAKKQGLLKAHQLMTEPKLDIAFAVWNMGEKGIIKQLMPIIFQSINYNQCIYIPRYFKKITLEYVKYYQKHYMGIISPKSQIIENQPKLLSYNQLIEKDSSRIKIRILCSEQLKNGYNAIYNNYYIDPLMNLQKIDFLHNLFNFKKNNTNYNDIIIHIHGGGFVSMSSRSHQTYTRKWANELNIPIFSIDYRLSPQYAFPDALDDCWQSYLWILYFSTHYFNIIPKRIILIGDSAGGNLCAALTSLCIRESIRPPDALILAYPALNLDPTNFNLHQLISLEDSLLPHTFLKLCIQAYIQDESLNYSDSLISPSEALDEVLQLFPNTYILTGTNDPLHGDTWKLLTRLLQLGVQCKMYKYDYMPHGFLSFDRLMPQCNICIQDVIILIKDILKQ